MRNCKDPTGASSCSGVICVFSMENCKFSQVDLMLIPIGRVDHLLELEWNSGVPVIDVKAPMIVMEAVKTVLIPVHAASLEAWLPNVPGTVWGQVVPGSSPRESAVKQGEQWVTSFLQAHGLQKILWRAGQIVRAQYWAIFLKCPQLSQV